MEVLNKCYYDIVVFICLINVLIVVSNIFWFGFFFNFDVKFIFLWYYVIVKDCINLYLFLYFGGCMYFVIIIMVLFLFFGILMIFLLLVYKIFCNVLLIGMVIGVGCCLDCLSVFVFFVMVFFV